jgi:hypothetical protein
MTLDYDVVDIGASKSVVISTISSLGYSAAYGYVLIGGAGFSLFIIFLILILYFIRGSPLSNVENLKWD